MFKNQNKNIAAMKHFKLSYQLWYLKNLFE